MSLIFNKISKNTATKRKYIWLNAPHIVTIFESFLFAAVA